MAPTPDTDDIRRRKTALRADGRRARQELPAAVRADASAEAVARLLALPEIADVAAVALYAATPDELDVTSAGRTLRERGTSILLPRVAGDRLVLVPTTDDGGLGAGYRSILEPAGDAADIGALDVVVVPGVAFDTAGRRLGRGGGHYDRLLAQLPATTTRIGVCFDAQIVDEIPAEPHDQAVDLVVTDARVLRQTVRRRR